MNDQQPLYLLLCNQDTLFTQRFFPDKPALTEGELDQIRRVKLVIYEGLKKAIEKGLPKNNTAILVDEKLGKQVLLNAPQEGYSAGFKQNELTKGYTEVITLDKEVFWQPIFEFFKGHIDGYAAAVMIGDKIFKIYQESRG